MSIHWSWGMCVACLKQGYLKDLEMCPPDSLPPSACLLFLVEVPPFYSSLFPRPWVLQRCFEVSQKS